MDNPLQTHPAVFMLVKLLYSCALLKNQHICLCVHVLVGSADIWDFQGGCQTVLHSHVFKIFLKPCKTNDNRAPETGDVDFPAFC